MTGRINCKAVISMALCMVMIAGILFPCNVHAASKYIGLVSENTCKKDDTAMYDVTNIRKAEQTISGKTSYSVKYGAKSFNLNCSTSGDGTLIYSSGNLNIAYVDYNGYVTVKGLGTTIITVNAPETDNYKAAYKMIKITVSKKKQTIGGHTVYDKTYGDPSFNLNCSTDGDGTLKYSSSNPNIVSVDANGDVVIKRSGKVTITVAASETSTYRSASKTININISKAAQTIKVREELAIIVEEGHYKLYNLGAVCDSGKVRYKSANTNIATVTSSGVVKANKWGGYTKIYVTALSDSKYKSASKTVKVRV